MLLRSWPAIRAPVRLLGYPQAPALHSAARFHSRVDAATARPVKITFIDPKEGAREVRGFEGQSVLEAAHSNDVPLEGACEGSLACSTCHGILEKGLELFPAPSEREEDLLDQAPGLTERSRLCCQLKLQAAKHDGQVTVLLPKITRNFYVDGHVPKPS